MSAYYNEIDPYAADWLRNLIAAGHIAPGDVDTRSISDVRPDDLKPYVQCHFFAGIGVWSHALRRGGWPDDRAVWTGSCPCQPFSVAGANAGMRDERHLWPHWHWLIEQRRPDVVFGEQVEAAIRHGWLDLVQADMEGIGYAFGKAGIPAAGFGAFHIRQRIYFVADTAEGGFGEHGRASGARGHVALGESIGCVADTESIGGGSGLRDLGTVRNGLAVVGDDRAICGVADACGERRREERDVVQPGQLDAPRRDGTSELADDDDAGLEGLGGGLEAESGRNAALRPAAESCEPCGVGDDDDDGPQGGSYTVVGEGMEHARTQPTGTGANGRSSSYHSGRTPADWLFCRDGKWRPVEPGTFPLAHAAPARVGRLRAFGNAIDAETATNFVSAYMEARTAGALVKDLI